MKFINHFKNYKLEFKESAKKDLKKLPSDIVSIIEKKFEFLVDGAENLDIKKLSGYKYPTYRLKHGNYRAIFEEYDKQLIILIIKVKHRREVYK